MVLRVIEEKTGPRIKMRVQNHQKLRVGDCLGTQTTGYKVQVTLLQDNNKE